MKAYAQYVPLHEQDDSQRLPRCIPPSTSAPSETVLCAR